MAISIKTPEEIELMRHSGAILSEVLETVCSHAKAGVSTYELDQIAEELIKSKGAKPAFKGFHGFPGTICPAINEVIVHGIPNKDHILQEGDIFTVDCGVNYKGFNTDAARTIGIGEVSKEKEKLMKVAKEALSKGTDMAKPGNRVGDISQIIEETIKKHGFHIIYELTGHGIGRELHEEPVILNYFDGNPGPVLKPGMTIAIEPIFAVSTSKMITLDDDWTIITADKSASVQEENTILITESGNEILTNQ